MKIKRLFGVSIAILILSIAIWVPMGEAGSEATIAVEPAAAAASLLWMESALTCRDSPAAEFFGPNKGSQEYCRTDPCFHPLMCASPCTACISGRCR